MSTHKFFLQFSLLIIISNGVYAQNSGTIDSLNKILSGRISDSARAKTLIALANEHYLESPESAVNDCRQSLSVSLKINYDEGIGEACGWLAYLNEELGQIDSAIRYYGIALESAKRTGSKKSEATIYNNLAAIYKDLGKIDEALKYHQISLTINKQLGNNEGIATSFNNIGLILQNTGKIPEALEYYSQALKIYETQNISDGIATSLQNLGTVYRDQKHYDEALKYFYRSLDVVTRSGDKYSSGYALNSIGGLYEEQNMLDSAMKYYSQALAVRTEINDAQGISYSLKNIGMVHEKKSKPDSAIAFYIKSLAGFEQLENKWGIAIAANLLGSVYLSKKNISKADALLHRSYETAIELGYPADIRNAAGNLQKLYRAKGDWKNALLMNDVFVLMRDSVQNDKNRKISLQNQFQYEYDKRTAVMKKEQEKKDAIAEEKITKQKIISNGFIIGFIVVLLFAGIFFLQRNKIAKEKMRSDELLLNILPEEVAEELKANGKTAAKDFSNVTVLFTDFKNFTHMSERLSAQELVNEINYCYSAFDNIITKYGIEKIKTIGDSYMCAGGLPVANKTNAVDTVSAAVEIRDFMLNEKLNREKEGKPFFEIRIGCNTGPVVAGIVGVKKFAYDIWGDTVNIASRMESSGEAGKINISGITYDLVKEKFACIHRGKIQAKNKGEIDMYFVENGV